jgi:hypothetical protein
VAKAEINVPWLPMRVIVGRVARHLDCAVEHARLRIIQEAEAGRIKACGLTVEGWPMSPLSAAWRGVDGDADVDLRLDALIAADLLPAPAERARWPAMLALAYIIEGMPLEGKEWSAEMLRQTERAEIHLGQAIGADQVPAWGRRSLYGPIERIPDGDFRAEMVEMKVPPVSATRLPKVVVRVDGNLGISPAHRFADYRGSHWSSIECDLARLKQAFPKPLRVERRMLGEAEQLYAEGGSEPAAHTEESMPEPAPAVEPPPPAAPQQPAPAPSSPQIEPEPPPAPKRRSRKKTAHKGTQRRRAIAVLNRIFPEGKYRDRYPDEDEMTWPDVWITFCEEYARYAKEYPSKYECPSRSTVRRAMGRAE